MNTRSTFDSALADGGRRQQVLAWTGLAGGIAPVLFAVAAVLLSWVNSSYLRDYGWTVSNHHGVPWPSSLAIGPHGWLMMVTFAITGVLLITLGNGVRRALPENRSGRFASKSVVVLGAAFGLSAFPVNQPNDATDVLSWTTSWHGRVHLVAFFLTIIASVTAVVATAIACRRDASWRHFSKLSVLAAVVLVVTFTLPSDWAWAWYLFLAMLLAWIAGLAARVRRMGSGVRAARPREGETG